MSFRSTALLSGLALLVVSAALPATPARSSAGAPAAEPAAGARVIDTAGGEVGSVVSVRGNILFVKTDRHEVAIPRSSFTPTEKGLLFALTREQLNAQVDAALSEPLLRVGAAVYDPQGGIVGTVTQFDDSLATVALASSVVQLPIGAFARGPKGPVIGETAASLEAKAVVAKSVLEAPPEATE